jgi:Flp pilus assembly protein CpaB
VRPLLPLLFFALAACPEPQEVLRAPPVDAGPKRGAAALGPAEAPLSAKVEKKSRSLTVSMAGCEGVRPGDHLDVIVSLREPENDEGIAFTSIQNARVLAADPPSSPAILAPVAARSTVRGAVPAPRASLRRITLELLAKDAQIAVEAARTGELHCARRAPGDVAPAAGAGRASARELVSPPENRDRPDGGPRPSHGPLVPGLRAISLPVGGAEKAREGDLVDVALTTRDPLNGEAVTILLLQAAPVLAVWPIAPEVAASVAPGTEGPTAQVELLVSTRDAEGAVAGLRAGLAHALLRNPGDLEVEPEHRRAAPSSVLGGDFEAGCRWPGSRVLQVQVVKGRSRGAPDGAFPP